MSRTITVDTGNELLGFINNLVESGNYKTKSEVVRDGLRLLKEKQANSQLEALRQLIDDGENSGKSVSLDIEKIISKARQEAGIKQ